MQWALAFRYGDPGFKERSDHSLNLFLTVVGVTFCRFVHCVSLALKTPMGNGKSNYVCMYPLVCGLCEVELSVRC